MKCPYCNYVNGWDFDTNQAIKGKEGSFYFISNEIKMEREDCGYVSKRYLTGCPQCNKVFMGNL